MPQHDVRLLGGDPGLLFLFFVETRHPFNRKFKRVFFLRRYGSKSRLYFSRGDFQLLNRCGFQAVETAGQLQYRRVTAQADGGDDFKHGLFNFAPGLFAAGKDRIELLIETGIIDVEKKHTLPCSVRFEQLLQSLDNI